VIRRALEVIAIVAMILASGVAMWAILDQSRGGDTEPQGGPIESVALKSMPLNGVPQKGAATARYAMVIFSDFECPFCRSFAQDTLPAFEAKYVASGEVRLAFRQFPLPSHKHAAGAARTAVCAGRQGKFWEVHDQLFDGSLEAAIGSAVLNVGLDRSVFDNCQKNEAAAAVAADFKIAREFAVGSTPSFLLGTVQPDGQILVSKRIAGNAPLSTFDEVIAGLVGGGDARK